MLTTLQLLAIQIITLADKLFFRGDSWKQTLPALVIGMLGIFLVIGIIIVATYALNKGFSKRLNSISLIGLLSGALPAKMAVSMGVSKVVNASLSS